MLEPLWVCGIVDEEDSGCCPGEWSVEEEGEEEEELEMGHLSHLNSFDFKGVCDESEGLSFEEDEDDGSDVDVDLVLGILAEVFV